MIPFNVELLRLISHVVDVVMYVIIVKYVMTYFHARLQVHGSEPIILTRRDDNASES